MIDLQIEEAVHLHSYEEIDDLIIFLTSWTEILNHNIKL